MNKKETDNQTHFMPIGMCLGMSIGVAIGTAMDNLAIGMCLGLGVGMCIGSAIDASKAAKNKENEQQKME